MTTSRLSLPAICNAVDEAEVIREFAERGLVDPGGDFTNPAIMPRQRLDYVLIPAMATVAAQHKPDGGERWYALSDHLPVMVEFYVGARLDNPA